MLPIDPTKANDAHYRYMMPAMIIKGEGRGNGVKTVFPNIRDICLAINRPEKILMKFFQTTLGAARNVSEKDDKFLIMGTHDEDRLTQELYSFITKYVLCPQCRNPETAVKLTPSKKGIKLTMQCGACGKESSFGEHDRTFTFFKQYYEKHPEEATVAKHAAQAKKEDKEDAAAAPAPAPEEKKEEKKSTVTKTSDLVNKEKDPRALTAEFMAKGDDNAEKLTSFLINLKSERAYPDESMPVVLIGAIDLNTDKDHFFAAVRRYVDVLRTLSSVQVAHAAGEVIGDKVRAEREKSTAKIQRYLIVECAKICQKLYKADTDKLALLVFMLYVEDVISEDSIAAFAQNKKLGTVLDAKVGAEMQAKVQKLVAWLQRETRVNSGEGVPKKENEKEAKENVVQE